MAYKIGVGNNKSSVLAFDKVAENNPYLMYILCFIASMRRCYLSKHFFESVRKPQRNVPLSGLVSTTVGIILFGFFLGVLQKWLDGTAIA